MALAKEGGKFFKFSRRKGTSEYFVNGLSLERVWVEFTGLGRKHVLKKRDVKMYSAWFVSELLVGMGEVCSC